LKARTSYDEDGVLRRIKAGFARRAGSRFVALGMGDDAALLRPTAGYETVLTCDWFLEGTHFLRDRHPADSVGWKCLARALSDVAAMGGMPRCFLLSLALPRELAGRWLDDFLGGLARAAKRFECPLAGGDTTERSEVLINITAIGETRRGAALTRNGARPGNLIYVTGRLGEAEMGLRLLREGKKISAMDVRLKKHLYPEPRLKVGKWLAEKGLATAMMDLSDGMSLDLKRLCDASGVGAFVHGNKLPVALGGKRDTKGEALNAALHGGDDYELLFTVAGKSNDKIPASGDGVKITRIGEIVHDSGVQLVDARGHSTPLQGLGWDPFREA
jgi:thiamine-monophosphate kinase